MKILLSLFISTFIFTLSFGFSQNLLAAGANVGIVVKKKGKVFLLTHPSKTSKGPGIRIKHNNGTYYTEEKVRPGSKIKNGNILKTKGPKAKARVVFKNGDQFNIAPGTEYEIKWKKSKVGKATASTVNLIYGSIRGIISPKGPRNKLKVRTRNAVMGVRGTDFNFTKVGTSGNTYVSVLRGKVTVSDPKNPKENISVAQGSSANVYSKTFLKRNKMSLTKKLELSRTTKNDLLRIQKDSKIEIKPEDQEEVAPAAVKAQIAKLEKKAVTVTLTDIKKYQPTVYAELSKKKFTNVANLNSLVVAKAYKLAPAKKAKKGFEELEMDLDEDSYKKYFKQE